MDSGREGTAGGPAATLQRHSLPGQPRSVRLSCLREGLRISFIEFCRVKPEVVCESHDQSTGCVIPWSIVSCDSAVSWPAKPVFAGERGDQPLRSGDLLSPLGIKSRGSTCALGVLGAWMRTLLGTTRLSGFGCRGWRVWALQEAPGEAPEPGGGEPVSREELGSGCRAECVARRAPGLQGSSRSSSW